MSCWCRLWHKRGIWLTIFAVNSQFLSVASGVAWSSAAGPKLSQDDIVTAMGTALLCGTVIGSLVAYPLLVLISRKTSLLVNAALNTASWIMLMWPSILPLLYAGRFVLGISASLAGLLLPAYEAEAFYPDDRQISGAVMCIYFSLGLLFEYSAAPFMSYEMVIYLNLVPPLLFLVLFWILGYDSPFTLIRAGKSPSSSLTFFWRHDVSEEEIKMELATVIERAADQGSWTKELIHAWTEPASRRGALLSFALIALFSMGGTFQLTMYLEEILSRADNSVLDYQTSSAVVGATKPLAALLSLPYISVLGARRALACTLLASTLSLVALGTYFFLQETSHKTPSSIAFLPLASVLVFFISGLMGSSTLPYVLRGELLPEKSRGPAGATTDSVCSLLSVASNIFFIAFEKTSLHVVFWVFSAVQLVEAAFVIYFVPETQNKTLREIHMELAGKTTS